MKNNHMGITKSNLIKTIALMVLFLFFSMLILIGFRYILKYKVLNVEYTATSKYDFKNGAIKSANDSNYTSHSEFEISDKTGLNNFAESVNDGGVNFENKMIYLMKDIDVDGSFEGIGVNPSIKLNYDQTAFRGEFRGQGHTISNFSITVDIYDMGLSYGVPDLDEYSMGLCGVGLFAGLGGTAKVSNLRIKNASISVPERWHHANGEVLAIGTIAGYVEGENDGLLISGCSVEKLSVSNYTTGTGSEGYELPGDLSVGGIVGQSRGSVIISNCYVEEFQSKVRDEYDDMDWGPLVVYYSPGAFCGGLDYDETCIIRDSIFNDENSYCTTTGTAFKYALCPDGSNVEDSVYITSDPFYENLSNKGSVGGEYESTWYYVSGYNEYPKLSKFIDWETLYFRSADEAVSSISPYKIEVPSDAIFQNMTGKTITVLEQHITAYIKNNYSATEYNWVFYDIPNEYNDKHYLLTTNAMLEGYRLSFSHYIVNDDKIDCKAYKSENGITWTKQRDNFYLGEHLPAVITPNDEAQWKVSPTSLVNITTEKYDKVEEISINYDGSSKTYYVSVFKSITYQFEILSNSSKKTYIKICFTCNDDLYAMYTGTFNEYGKYFYQPSESFYISKDMSTRSGGQSIRLQAVKKEYDLIIN